MSTVLMFLSPLGERPGEGMAAEGMRVNPLTQPLPKGERSKKRGH
jgi:hypothetical protein